MVNSPSYNRKLDAETAEMIIANRCLDQDYPNISDILGSDWGACYPMRQRTPEEYMKLAIDHAYRILPKTYE